MFFPRFGARNEGNEPVEVNVNEIAPDPKAVIEALESRIVRLEDALHALLEYRIGHGWHYEENMKRQARIMKNFRESISDERKGE